MSFFNTSSNVLASISKAGDLYVRVITQPADAPVGRILMRGNMPEPPAGTLPKLAWHPSEQQILVAASGSKVSLFAVPSADDGATGEGPPPMSCNSCTVLVVVAHQSVIRRQLHPPPSPDLPAEDAAEPLAPGIEFATPTGGAVTSLAFSNSGGCWCQLAGSKGAGRGGTAGACWAEAQGPALAAPRMLVLCGQLSGGQPARQPEAQTPARE
jgi:hypothetical protein